MGKASRKKKELKATMSAGSRKVLKDMLKECSPSLFVATDGNKEKNVFYNPLKKLLKGEPYKTEEGAAVTKNMVEQYENFLKKTMEKKDGNSDGSEQSEN